MTSNPGKPVATSAAERDLVLTAIDSPVVQDLRQRVEKGGLVACRQVARGAQAFVAALLRELFPGRPLVIVADGVKAQELIQQDVETWLRHGGSGAAENTAKSIPFPAAAVGEEFGVARAALPFFYPAWETLPHEAKLPHADIISERLETLVALSGYAKATHGRRKNSGPAPAVVTSVMALMQRTFTRDAIAERTRTVRSGDRIEPVALLEWLEAQGYESEAQVTQKGEVAMRGGIVDLFPLTSPWPVRVEFFGDEIESMRQFDPISQISRETIHEVTLPPAGEIGLLKQTQDAPLSTLLEYLPPHALWVLCEPEQLRTSAEAYSTQVPDEDRFFVEWDELLDQISQRHMTRIDLMETEELLGDGETGLALNFASLETYRPLSERSVEPQIAEAQRRDFFQQLHRWLRQGFSVHVFCNNLGERDRFGEIWAEYGLGTLPEGPEQPVLGEIGRLSTELGSLSRGFVFDESRIVAVTDAEIFGRYKVQRPRKLKSRHAAAARSALDIDFTDLEEGDYVVHLQHGIGRYCGLTVLPSGHGRRKGQEALESGVESLVIEYAAGDADQAAPRLYVPVNEAHLVSKYVGTGKSRPPLNTLGGARWAKTKAQAEEAVRDLAGQLLSLQAARESQSGHLFPPDTPWQREFEGSFLYEETPDQMRAIIETKRDMESPKPMDRLICGDVGYGKTEVAIRAAFKSVMGGRQVAMLVPTTILAQQHYNNFRERMADYPVRVAQLSRFCTRRDQKRIIQELADGSVDIVIGTHRLLQDDIAFKELGLVIVDEEQRFGVLHKEKLKLLRTLVDVLTLSATPIPRTLYLALTGARDMSTIETPPQDRLPVETIVAQYDERTIRDAIQREINRQGQVYYLHNRVHDIESVALRIRALVPKARVVVGHGQMNAEELEDVMALFINGEADVLVSTTIIESGIDIPNANTIIIDRADRFGLSDLYQLRGRVGRYKHQAYAYLLLPRHATLLTDARKRISAIRQYSSLGSGFKIAMRDLEIRGAGNLLGPEQSGHITAVGFELYCQLLKQSVSSLKGEKVRPRVDVAVRLDFIALRPGEIPENKIEDEPAPRLPPTGAYIPYSYISEPRQRIEIYRKIAQVTDKNSLSNLQAEMRDRFGKLPPPVELLLQITELKYLAAERGVSSIESKEGKLMLTQRNDYVMVSGKFPRLTRKEAKARLNEIKRFLLAIGTGVPAAKA